MREKFERFGEIRDVYLPRDYYTGYDTSYVLTNTICTSQYRGSHGGTTSGVDKQEQDCASIAKRGCKA